jgi:hypothetical protein
MPGRSEPRWFSRNIRNALPLVWAMRASSRVRTASWPCSPPSDRPVTAHHRVTKALTWAARVQSVPSPQLSPLSATSRSGTRTDGLARMTPMLRNCTVTPSRRARDVRGRQALRVRDRPAQRAYRLLCVSPFVGIEDKVQDGPRHRVGLHWPASRGRCRGDLVGACDVLRRRGGRDAGMVPVEGGVVIGAYLGVTTSEPDHYMQ